MGKFLLPSKGILFLQTSKGIAFKKPSNLLYAIYIERISFRNSAMPLLLPQMAVQMR